jgi:hypothetical protein
MHNATVGGRVAGADVVPSAPPVISIPALPSVEQAQQVPRFAKAFESSTGREASAAVEGAAAAASRLSVFSHNLMLAGVLAALPILGCITAARRRSYLRSWSQVPNVDADACLIGSE